MVLNPMTSATLQRLSSATTKDQSFSEIRLNELRCNASRAFNPYVLPWLLIKSSASLRTACPKGSILNSAICS